MSETDKNTKRKKVKTSKLAKLLPRFTIISVLCFISFFFNVTNIAKILFLLSVTLAVILGIVCIFQIKLSNGKLKDMGLPIIGGIIIPVVLVGVVLVGIVIGNAMDTAMATIRLIICKKELETLGNALQIYSTTFDGKYPISDKWCDLLIQYTDVNKTSFGKFAVDGCSNYGINPNAEPNSPNDVVLLFESKGGWNQSGGPGLLTTENHEGRGYNILFNDGHVVSVRPEEVDKLKWKDEQKE